MGTADRKPKGWDDGTAWIAEDTGSPNGDPFDDDGMFALARFDAHVESGSLASGFRQGPSGVSAEEAVAWARRHAARVIVRWFGPGGTTHASAGERPVIWDDGKPLPPWNDDLQLAPRRMPGWEHLDRTDADAPISWEVILRGDAFEPPSGFADAFEATLRAEDDVELVAFAFKDTSPVLPEDGSEVGWVAWGDGLQVHLRLEASTHAQACGRGEALVRRAAVAPVYRARPDTPDVHLGMTDAFPTGSEAARSNARIDPDDPGLLTTGERDLATLLASMDPAARPDPYVVVTVDGAGAIDDVVPDATIREDEGLTVVLPQSDADRLGLSYDFVTAWITLRVHSALDAVGLTAEFSLALADAGLSCNVLAGFHHDHLLVPWEDRDAAIAALRALSADGA